MVCYALKGNVGLSRRPLPAAPDEYLDGAAEIGKFLGLNLRQTFYHLENNRIPHFRIGRKYRARKPVLRDWMAGQERASADSC